MPDKPHLLGPVRDNIRLKHYCIRTDQAYVDGIKRFILFHNKKNPATMGTPAVEPLLSHLAVAGKVAASAQNQALAAL